MVFRIILQNVIFVKVQIRDFPANKSMDYNKTEMADVRLFDCCNLLRFMMNLDTHRIAQTIRRTVGRWVSEKYRRRPMIVPTVLAVRGN